MMNKDYQSLFVDRAHSPRTGYMDAYYVLQRSTKPSHLKYPTPFYKVTKDIKAFKFATDKDGLKAYIVNLIIPKGAKVHMGYSRTPGGFHKCRANKVIVHSVVGRLSGKEVKKAYSTTASLVTGERIKYEAGAVIDITSEFSNMAGTCRGGIHFFLDVRSAYYYMS